MAFPTDKPSIAVLSFKNMSGEAEQEYFADGLTDDLISDLSKISGLFVIARNSTVPALVAALEDESGRARRGDHRPGQDRPAGEGGDRRIRMIGCNPWRRTPSGDLRHLTGAGLRVAAGRSARHGTAAPARLSVVMSYHWPMAAGPGAHHRHRSTAKARRCVSLAFDRAVELHRPRVAYQWPQRSDIEQGYSHKIAARGVGRFILGFIQNARCTRRCGPLDGSAEPSVRRVERNRTLEQAVNGRRHPWLDLAAGRMHHARNVIAGFTELVGSKQRNRAKVSWVSLRGSFSG